MSSKNIEFKLKHFEYSHITDCTFKEKYDCNLNDFCNRDYEIFCLIKGSSKLNIQGESYYLSPNDFVIIKPFELHRYNIDYDKTFEYIHVRINACCLSQLSTQLKDKKTVYKFPEDLLNKELRNFEQLYESCPTILKDGVTCSAALNFLTEFCMCKTLNMRAPTSVNNTFSSVVEYTYKNYATIDSIENLSTAISVNKEKIRRSFLRRMDIHITDFIRRLRLFAAEDLIEHGESLYKILPKAGFTAYSTFLRAYKNQYKHLPSKQTQRDDLYPFIKDFSR